MLLILSLALAFPEAPALADTNVTITTHWEGDKLSCPDHGYRIKGKLYDMPTSNPGALSTGDLEDGQVREKYRALDPLLGNSSSSEMKAEEKEYLFSQQPIFAATYSEIEPLLPDTLSNTCLPAAARLEKVKQAIALTDRGRLEAGALYRELETFRKQKDSRPDCPVQSTHCDDATYFQYDPETMELAYVRDQTETYACTLSEYRQRLDGIQRRLQEKELHEQGLGEQCKAKAAEKKAEPYDDSKAPMPYDEWMRRHESDISATGGS